jgi:putative acetyltransferase
MSIEIRAERSDDVAAIRDVNRLAFEQEQEADIVDAVRSNGAALVSLVATSNGRIVGHVLYSPVSVNGTIGAGLGPMAVHPDHQRQGIGSALIDAGNATLRQAGCPFVVVVGHAAYYPRFGFKPASSCGLTCEWDVPDNVFMVLVLDQAKMAGVSGLARYRHEFSTVA